MREIFKKPGYTPMDIDEKNNLFCSNCFRDITDILEFSWKKYCHYCDTKDIHMITFVEKNRKIRENKIDELLR